VGTTNIQQKDGVLLIQNYQSPRWSAEILDCSMPMTFDTYSVCAFNCLYCFSFYQKVHSLKGYLQKKVRSVNPEVVKQLFLGALNEDYENMKSWQMQFVPYIRGRYVMQWGALADPFDWFEKVFGVTLELMRFFDEIDYPLSFSTKGTFFTEDERYMEVIRRHKHNWHFKISVITANEEKARLIEQGVPSPTERFKAMERLAKAGIHVTLRLRPYIIGISDDWKEVIDRAVDAGVDSMTTEFFCMEARADKRVKQRYKEMSQIAGYDIWTFYMKNSPQHGYKRLKREIKEPIITAMREYAHKKGIRFHSSDAHGRHLQDAPNCCGVPPAWKSQYAHFGTAILIAKEKGYVKWSDIAPAIYKLFGHFEWNNAVGYNTGNTKNRALFFGMSMADWIRWQWNNPQSGVGLVKMYGHVVEPAGKDENGDIIYKWVGGKRGKKT